jgi:hypothetical protein
MTWKPSLRSRSCISPRNADSKTMTPSSPAARIHGSSPRQSGVASTMPA